MNADQNPNAVADNVSLSAFTPGNVEQLRGGSIELLRKKPKYPRDLKELLESRSVRAANGCLEWTGGRTDDGYGMIRNRTKNLLAHRVAWELSKGPIPKGFMVCHHCDNPPCIDPEHLFVGTAKDNTDDMMKKGRHGRPSISNGGYHNRGSKISPPQVLEIRASSLPRRTLASMYGVTPEHIDAIRRRAYRKWVQPNTI